MTRQRRDRGNYLYNKMDAPSRYIVMYLLALTAAVEAQDFCSPSKPSSPAVNPPTLSPSYQARVEVNFLDKNYSMTVDEYLDYDGNRGAMIINQGGQTKNVILSYVTNEVFEITDQSCKVYSVEQSPFTFLFGPANSTGGPHIFTAAASLRFSADNNLVYNGTANVRGIPANVWYTCLTWQGAVGHVRATYYFSEVGWNTSSPLQQIPLRVEVQGLMSTTNAASRAFHHIYDLVGYQPDIETSSSIFETPPDVVCLNRTNERSLPTFQPHFQYRAEIVDSTDSSITHYAMWYDENIKMVREDTRKIDPTKVTSTTTEIHDFNTGVRYVIDRIDGCTVESIDPSLSETDQDVTKFRFNGSLDVDIRDPNSFFVVNHNYTYTGPRIVRGINCDIFSTIVPGYVLQGSKYDAIFEYAFLTDGWNDVPLYSTETDVQNYPVQLVISIRSIAYTRLYNFFEFAEANVSYPIFDVSTCFDETQKLGFQITFPGTFGTGSEAQWTYQVYQALVKSTRVFPARIGGITITNDDDNIYANSYLLGSSVLAQFNFTGFAIERENDKLVKGVLTLDSCASLCVDNPDFTCQGFLYCPDDGFACRLGREKVATNDVPSNGTACKEYSRRIKVPPKKEPTLQESYGYLQTAVYQQTLQIQITESGGKLAPYTAINVHLFSGKIVASKPLPTLPSAFSYRMEIVVPKSTSVQEIFIWYDQSMKIVRYDSKDPTSDNSDMMTIIHDFNSGVAFEMDQITQVCNEMPIPSSKVFDVIATGALSNGAISVTMKTSSALFFLDDTYKYIGEGTARGILCDVFESKRSDFNDDHHNTTSKDTVFKYYFQSGAWTYTSPSSTVPAQNQPVQLNVEEKSTGDYYTYNFYDFTERHFANSFYDTQSCYQPDETKDFVIVFSDQLFVPDLDDISNVFLQNALNLLSQLTFMSPISFQRTYLTYDDDDIYMFVTVLGHTTLLNLFTPAMTVSHNTTDNMINAISNSDCASACVLTSSFVCNSFDYCPSASGPNCLLGAQRSETAPDATDDSGLCTHFARTENDTYRGMSIQQMYLTVTNTVFDGKFNVTVQLQNGTKVTYVATSVRDDIVSPYSPSGTEGSYLQKFTAKQGFQLNSNLENVTHNSVSLTDCAMYCIQENTFDCQAFDYQFLLSSCKLSSVHPDELNGTTNSGLVKNSFSAVYARFYTADYTKYDAVVYDRHPDKIFTNVKTDELCARACTDNTDFVCEAFEVCTDGTCQLRRTHVLDKTTPPSGTTPIGCTHYSRNHLYDYVRRDNQIIEGHDDTQLEVNNVAMCAQLCGSGDGLVNCASFEICEPQQGVIVCTLSTADPTVQKDLIFDGSMECSLYTRANPANSGPTATTSSHNGTWHSRSPYTGTWHSRSPYTGTGTPPTAKTDKLCSGGGESSSDTGTRVGIAFGTLFLGLLVGAAIMLLFVRIRYGRHGVQEDATVLKTWDN